MLTKIIQIGNSRGIRIPQNLLKQYHLTGEVDLKGGQGKLVIAPVERPRNWDAEFRRMRLAGDDRLLDPGSRRLTQWEAGQWEW